MKSVHVMLLAVGCLPSAMIWANDYLKLEDFSGFQGVLNDRDRFIIAVASNEKGPDGVFRHRVFPDSVGRLVPMETVPLLLEAPLKQNADLGFQEMLVTDMNGDRVPDLVVSRELGRLVWYEGDFDDGFYQLDSYTHILGRGEVSKVTQLAAGDLDGDGDQDVLFNLLGELEWLEQPAHASDDGPSWARHATAIEHQRNDDAVVSDLDGDGLADIVTIQMEGNRASLSWWRNQGKEAGFQKEELATITSQVYRQPMTMTVADMDADGHRDVVFLDGNGVLNWLKNPVVAEETWERRRIFVHGRPTSHLITADLDADGDVDVLPSESGYWYANQGVGEPWKQQYLPISKDDPDEMTMMAEDWNGDGFMDLAMVYGDDHIEIEVIAGPLTADSPTFVRPLELPQPEFEQRVLGNEDYLNLSWQAQADVIDIVEMSEDLKTWEIWSTKNPGNSDRSSLTFAKAVPEGAYFRIRRVRE